MSISWADVVRQKPRPDGIVKENAAPKSGNAARISYPKLPSPPKSKPDRSRFDMLAQSPYVQQALASAQQHSPANISRRRDHDAQLSLLTNTPPRPSHMSRMSRHFTNAGSSAAATGHSGNQHFHVPQDTRDAAIKSTLRYYDQLPFDKETQSRLSEHQATATHFPVRYHPGPIFVASSTPWSSIESAPIASSRPDSALSWQQRPEAHAVTMPPRPIRPVIDVQRVATPKRESSRHGSYDDTSSDSWTDDDEYMPRSARRRAREERLAKKQKTTGSYDAVANESRPQPATALREDGPLSPVFHERLLAARSPRTSRFHGRPGLANLPSRRLSAFPDKEPSEKAGLKLSSLDIATRPSAHSMETRSVQSSDADADDEESSSSNSGTSVSTRRRRNVATIRSLWNVVTAQCGAVSERPCIPV